MEFVSSGPFGVIPCCPVQRFVLTSTSGAVLHRQVLSTSCPRTSEGLYPPLKGCYTKFGAQRDVLMPAYATLTSYDGDKNAKNKIKHEWKNDRRVPQAKGHLMGAFMEESVIAPGYD